MIYAVVRIAGHQYKIATGQEILVDKLASEKVAADVLFFTDGASVRVGRPILNDVKINFKILGEVKGEKIDIRKYKAKSRYRRHLGFRPQFTRLLVEKISS